MSPAVFVPNRIIVHHSATRDSGTVSWGAIRNFHMHQMKPPMQDIGYHAGIELVGDHFECMVGRTTDIPGAHTKFQNARSLGFCFVGNYDEVAPPREMLEIAAKRVLAPWCAKFHVPVSEIHGHREFASKTCPGTLFSVELLREIVRKELGELA